MLSRITSFSVRALRFLVGSSKANWYLRHFNTVGPGARIFGGRPIVENNGRIQVGKKFLLKSSYASTQFSTGSHGQLTIGDGVFVNYGVFIHAEQEISIGNNCQVGQYSIISDVSVPGAPPSAADRPQPIRIEDDVWIAGRVVVLPGSIIGKGAVIAAGSIVSGSIPPGVIARGIPARAIRHINVPPVVVAATTEATVADVVVGGRSGGQNV